MSGSISGFEKLSLTQMEVLEKIYRLKKDGCFKSFDVEMCFLNTRTFRSLVSRGHIVSDENELDNYRLSKITYDCLKSTDEWRMSKK